MATLENSIIELLANFDYLNELENIDLSNFSIISSIITHIDKNVFSEFSTPFFIDQNWAVKATWLKKVVEKLTEMCLARIGTCNIKPDTILIAKNGNIDETCKLYMLIITDAAYSDKAAWYIQKLGCVSEERQQIIKNAIEQIVSELPLKSVNSDINIDAVNILQSPSKMQQIEEKISTTATMPTSIQQQIEHKPTAALDMEKYDIVPKSLLDAAKSDIIVMERRIEELEEHIQNKEQQYLSLQKKYDDVQVKLVDLRKIQDDNTELKHASDKLQQVEVLIDKYKKKVTELENNLAHFEQENLILQQKLKGYELSDRPLPLFSKKRDAASNDSNLDILTDLEDQLRQMQIEKNLKDEQILILESRLNEFESKSLTEPSSNRSLNNTIVEELPKARIIQLMTDKENLMAQNIELKDELLAMQKANNKSETEIALLKRLDESEVRIGRLNDQISQYEKELAKAKDTIAIQVQQIKDSSDRSSMSSESLQAELTVKENELNQLKKQFEEYKLSVNTEQKLILSAWYDLGKEKLKSHSTWLSSQRSQMEKPAKIRQI